MKIAAIDVETTGLDRREDQILELAVVFDDLSMEQKSDPTMFHCYVVHERIAGHAFALNMNKLAIERIARRTAGYSYIPLADVAQALFEFVKTFGYDLCDYKDGRACLNIAGKNYAAFDQHFIERLPRWSEFFRPSHRSIDPLALFLQVGDKQPPDLSTCLTRAGLNPDVKHEAASDAIAVLSLLRSRYGV